MLVSGVFHRAAAYVSRSLTFDAAAEQAITDQAATTRLYAAQCRAQGDDFGVRYTEGNL
jgi:hypothetical protein